MMTPIAISGVESEATREKIERLERDLATTMGALQLLAARLEGKLGSEFLGAELARFAQAGKDGRVAAMVDAIDEMVRAGKHPEAARQFREAYGVTWDEAHQGVRRWAETPREKHLKRLWLAECLKALGSSGV